MLEFKTDVERINLIAEKRRPIPTVTELAKEIGIGASTLYKLRRGKRLKYDTLLIIEQWLEENE